MWIKKKNKIFKGKSFAREVLEYLFLSFLVSAFLFYFLYHTCISIAETYVLDRAIRVTSEQAAAFYMWLRSACILAAVFLFLVLFLFLLGQRLSYLLVLIKGVESLREHPGDFSIPVEGQDEFAALAEGINFLAATQAELNHREKEISRKREELIRSLSHDIRTTLTSLLSYSEYLEQKEQLESEEVRSFISLVHSKAGQMKLLTEQLLETGKSAEEPGTPLDEISDLHLLFRQFLDEWESLLEDQFVCHTTLTCPREFSCFLSVSDLHRIFDNLISNIEKYADPGHPVEFSIEADETSVIMIQKNKIRSLNGNMPESSKIGLENIQKTADKYRGSADALQNDDIFEIQIQLYFPSFL